jgi:LmbE family N-acetylglucosaminyl deacetylase
MERRDFFAGALGLFGASQLSAQTVAPAGEVFIERAATGEPHKGKVLALITPHLDDGPGLACGTVAKLLKEGYTGYFIRTTNDEKDSYDLSLGETVAANEQDAGDFLKACGLKQWFDLGYRNHRLDDVARAEMRVRMIFLFRLLMVDTVVTFDPWGHYEENPDHYVTGQVVEASCWMAGLHRDMPEQFAVGLKPHAVRERYYFARGPQLVIHTMKDMMASPAGSNLHLPALAGDETAAIDEFARLAVERRAREVGKKYGLEYAEAFHYVGPEWFVEQDVLRHPVKI